MALDPRMVMIHRVIFKMMKIVVIYSLCISSYKAKSHENITLSPVNINGFGQNEDEFQNRFVPNRPFLYQ